MPPIAGFHRTTPLVCCFSTAPVVELAVLQPVRTLYPPFASAKPRYGCRPRLVRVRVRVLVISLMGVVRVGSFVLNGRSPVSWILAVRV